MTKSVDQLEWLLQFALDNHDKFTEHDPDGVKAAWIEWVQEDLNEYRQEKADKIRLNDLQNSPVML